MRPTLLGAAKRNLTALAHQFAKNKGGAPKEAERSRLISDEEVLRLWQTQTRTLSIRRLLSQSIEELS